MTTPPVSLLTGPIDPSMSQFNKMIEQINAAVASSGGGAAPAGTLTGSTLAGNVINSSLTSLGALSSLHVSGGSQFDNGAVIDGGVEVTGSSSLDANTIATNGTGTLTAVHFVGDGSGLTGLPSGATTFAALTDIIDDLNNNIIVSGVLPASIDITSAQNNTAFGNSALISITIGAENTVVGSQAAGAITSGNRNTVVGALASVSGATALNQIVIGDRATAAADNTAQIGNANITDVYFGDGITPVLHTGTITNDGTNIFSVGAHTTGILTAAGSIAITLNGTTYQLLTSA